MDLGQKFHYLKNKTGHGVQKEIREMTEELIKANYCRYRLNNPPLTEPEYNKKLDALRKKESMHPRYALSGSPTKYVGFDEKKAIEVYGEKDWTILKDTLNLTVEGTAICHNYW